MSTEKTCLDKLKAARADADTWEKGSCYGHAWWVTTDEVHLSSPFYHLRTTCCGEAVSGAPEDTHGTMVNFSFRSRNEKVHLGQPEEDPFVQQYLRRRLHKSQDVCYETPVCSLQPTMLDFIVLTSLFVVIFLCCYLKVRQLRKNRVRDRRDLVDLDAEAASRGMSAELAIVSGASKHGVEKAQQQLQFIRSMDGLNVSDDDRYHIQGDAGSMGAGTVGGGAPLPSSWVVGEGSFATPRSPVAPQESSAPAHESSAAAQESSAAQFSAAQSSAAPQESSLLAHESSAAAQKSSAAQSSATQSSAAPQESSPQPSAAQSSVAHQESSPPAQESSAAQSSMAQFSAAHQESSPPAQESSAAQSFAAPQESSAQESSAAQSSAAQSSAAPQESSPPAQESSAAQPIAAPQESSPQAEKSSAAQSSAAPQAVASTVKSTDTVEVDETFTNTVEEKADGKEEVAVRKLTLHEEVTEWLEILSGEKLTVTDPSVDDIAAWLKDGRVLCSAANKIKPNIVKSIKKGKIAIKHRENINSFLAACRSFGLEDTFDVPDLHEAKNMERVLTCIYALGGASRSVAGFEGPFIGSQK
eukprot:TRINITY_DN7305_c0_g1_i6.p1 TRINITY_DN7305_c0_g1~~TRINITY_DN7305_c0_g1_i6.p1  ORF type:complete len:585 (-),score=107.09 TRINITY_DN7305_c0_g1_i6:101-1855(-)